MGFEPTRAEPNGLAVHRLNHSATSPHNFYPQFAKIYKIHKFYRWYELCVSATPVMYVFVWDKALEFLLGGFHES